WVRDAEEELAPKERQPNTGREPLTRHAVRGAYAPWFVCRLFGAQIRRARSGGPRPRARGWLGQRLLRRQVLVPDRPGHAGRRRLEGRQQHRQRRAGISDAGQLLHRYLVLLVPGSPADEHLDRRLLLAVRAAVHQEVGHLSLHRRWLLEHTPRLAVADRC